MAHFGTLHFLDLETTGTNPVADRITEIGILTLKEGQLSRWSTLVNPEIGISPFIQKLTGITDAMVRDAPTFGELQADLRQRLEGGILVAHNARFDYGFLRNAFKQAGAPWRCPTLCTVKLSRRLFPHEARHNLDTLIVRHQLDAGVRHRALADAELLWQLWNALEAAVAPDVFAAALAAQLQRPTLPPHLDHEALDQMPDTPGVYLFYGDNQIPLYVGKSIHLRQRVLSHFNADHRLYKDMRLSHQIRRVEWRCTAGETGALLLEAQLVKEMQPIHNRVLRRQRELCAWQLHPGPQGQLQPVLAYASAADFGQAQGLYGLFRSRRQAEDVLRDLAERHDLCLATLGLEKTGRDKPCFARQLQRCSGACVDVAQRLPHQQRLQQGLEKLKVVTWPFPGPVALIEAGPEGHCDWLVVNNWCYLGTVSGASGRRATLTKQAHALLTRSSSPPLFDRDTYNILTRALEQDRLDIELLAASTDAAAVRRTA